MPSAHRTTLLAHPDSPVAGAPPALLCHSLATLPCPALPLVSVRINDKCWSHRRHAGRAAFALHNLWATPFAEGEDSAAGDHTAMSVAGNGLPHFTRNDRSIVDCDLVTWHTLGLTHVPR